MQAVTLKTYRGSQKRVLASVNQSISPQGGAVAPGTMRGNGEKAPQCAPYQGDEGALVGDIEGISEAY